MKNFYSKILLVISILLIAYTYAEAKQENDLQGGWGGTDAVFSIHPGDVDTDSLECIYIYIDSPEESTTTLTIPALDILNKQQGKMPHKFKLTAKEALCYLRKPEYYPVKDSVWAGRAIVLSIGNSNNASIYVVAKYPNSSESFTINTSSNLGTNYVISTLPDPVPQKEVNKTKWLPPYVSITAAYDETKVKFTLYGNDSTTTESGLIPGKHKVKTLQKGDVWLIPAVGKYADLSGSIVTANKPVSVTSGNYSANKLGETEGGNYTIEQEAPLYSWGKTYFVPPVYGREKHQKIQVFAKDSASKIFKNGGEIIQIDGPGGFENEAWTMIEPGENDGNKPLIISGNKPINAVLYNMPGEDDANNTPFKMNLMHENNFERKYGLYLFNDVDVSFSKHYQAVVFKNNSAQLPDEFEVRVTRNGESNFKPVQELSGVVDVLDIQPFETFDGFEEKWYCATLRIYADSLESNVAAFRSNDKFGLYSYGFDENNGAYAHIGQEFQGLETPDTVPPQPKYTIDAFGNVPAMSHPADSAIVVDWGTDPRFPPNDPDRTANLGLIVLHNDESINYDFDYEEFIPGEDRSTTWSLRVRDPNIEAKAVITFTDRAGNDTTIVINYVPDKIDFEEDPIVLNSEYNILKDSIRITNNHEDFVTEISFNGTVPEGVEASHEFPFTIQPQTTVYIVYSIDADHEGSAYEEWTFLYSKPYSDFKMGKGLKLYVNSDKKQPVLASDGVDFGDVVVKRTKEMMLEISNPATKGATDTLIINSVQETFYTGEFGSGKIFEAEPITKPIRIPVDSSHKFKVRFTPDDTLDWNSFVKFSTNETFKSETIYLQGSGKEPIKITKERNFGDVKADPNEYKFDNFMEFPKNYRELENAIFYENKSNDEVKILDAEFKSLYANDKEVFFDKVNDEYFNLDTFFLTSRLIGRTIPAYDSLKIPLYFLPKDRASYSFSVVLYLSNSVDYYVKIEGRGVVPRISPIKNVHLGKPAAGTELTENIIIKNNSFSDEAELVLYDMLAYPLYKISSDWNNYGEKNFKYDRPDFPVTIDKQDGIDFDVAYRGEEADTVYFKTRSDAKDDIEILVWAGEGTGVKYKIISKGLKIVPNPAKDKISIQTEKSLNNAVLEVFDIAGVRQIKLEDINFAGNYYLNTSGLSPGSYILRVWSGEEIYQEEFIIAR